MKLLLLGTAAAEAWPAPFCLCHACETARQRGGPNLRTRSNALLDDDLKIDFGPDTVSQLQRTGRHLNAVRTLIFTHQHADHITPPELICASEPFTRTPLPSPLVVYGNQQVMEQLYAEFPEPAKKNLEFRKLRMLQEIETPSGDRVLPMPADHVTGAFTLRITRGDKTIFYGHDSGLYPQATIDALASGPPLDIALMDCTHGDDMESNRNHMSIAGVIEMTELLRQRGAIHDHTRVIATHFSHNGNLAHEELVRAFLPHGIEVAFDGMTVEVQ
jgi:phosphoribosyl 1,2-cyclic phosphate phosphodiesterase